MVLQHIKKLTSCKTDAFHSLYITAVPVHLTCSVLNQVQACDMYHLCFACVVCVHWQACAWQNCMLQFVHAKFLWNTCRDMRVPTLVVTYCP